MHSLTNSSCLLGKVTTFITALRWATLSQRRKGKKQKKAFMIVGRRWEGGTKFDAKLFSSRELVVKIVEPQVQRVLKTMRFPW